MDSAHNAVHGTPPHCPIVSTRAHSAPSSPPGYKIQEVARAFEAKPFHPLISLPFHPPLTPMTGTQAPLLYCRGEVIFTSVLETCEEVSLRLRPPLLLFLLSSRPPYSDLSNHPLIICQERRRLPPLPRPCRPDADGVDVPALRKPR
jgi:hypothetical protein